MTISWQDFEKIDLRAGTIVDVQDFPKARKPAYKIWVDLGKEIGVKRSSAQSHDTLFQRAIVGQTSALCD